MTARPLFSIGVPTYNRKPLLLHTLRSIERQTFGDFEVLVGNDDVREELSPADLGIADARFRFINHVRNVGEIRNMNALLAQATGTYFTWQFDDDFYATDFLAGMHAAIAAHRSPQAVFSGFRHHYGLAEPRYAPAGSRASGVEEVAGEVFLADVFGGRRRALGACGVYDRTYLESIGGIKDISGETIGLYSEHVLLLEAGRLERVVHIDAPLVAYRDQNTSWSRGNLNVELYVATGTRLVRELLQLAGRGAYGSRLEDIVAGVVATTADDIVNRMVARDGRVAAEQIAGYFTALEHNAAALEPAPTRQACLAAIARVRGQRRWTAILKGWVKRSPPWVQHILRAIRARLS